jgi:hypothetical protein
MPLGLDAFGQSLFAFFPAGFRATALKNFFRKSDCELVKSGITA